MTELRKKLKEEIKSLALQIKDAKKNRRDAQRNAAPITQKYCQMSYLTDSIEERKSIVNEYYAANDLECNAVRNVVRLKYEFRHKHIVASLLRGRTREQIERKTETTLTESYILQLLKDYGASGVTI